MSTALEKITFTPEQVGLIKRTIAPDFNDNELALFVHYAQAKGLDPLSREVYAFKNGGKVVMGVGIDGLRRNAMQSSGRNYAPGRTTFQEDDKGQLVSATVTVKRWYPDARQWMEAEGVAYFKECAKNTPPWRERPRHMLAKCAEALALRQMFPEFLDGLAILDGREVLSEPDCYPEAIDSTAEEVSEAAPVISAPPPPAPPSDPPKKRGRPPGSTNKPAEVPPPVPVEAVAEPVTVQPEVVEPGHVVPPARPGAPIDGFAERKRLLALADEMGIKSLMGGLRGGAGLDVDPSKWTAEGIARLEWNMEIEAIERGWKRPEAPKPEEF